MRIDAHENNLKDTVTVLSVPICKTTKSTPNMVITSGARRGGRWSLALRQRTFSSSLSVSALRPGCALNYLLRHVPGTSLAVAGTSRGQFASPVHERPLGPDSNLAVHSGMLLLRAISASFLFLSPSATRSAASQPTDAAAPSVNRPTARPILNSRLCVNANRLVPGQRATPLTPVDATGR